LKRTALAGRGARALEMELRAGCGCCGLCGGGGLFFVEALAALDVACAVADVWAGRDFVREGDVAAGAEAADVGAVFVFDAEERPHASPEDLAHRYAERGYGGVLELERCDHVHDPVEAKDRVDEHRCIVPPDLLVAEFFTQEPVLGMWIAQTPVVVDVPEAGVNTVDGCERDEGGFCDRFLVHAVDAKCGVEHDGSEVLPAVEQMREFVSSVGVTAYTLQSAPYTGECSQEAHDA